MYDSAWLLGNHLRQLQCSWKKYHSCANATLHQSGHNSGTHGEYKADISRTSAQGFPKKKKKRRQGWAGKHLQLEQGGDNPDQAANYRP